MKTNLLVKTRDLIQREAKPAFLKELDLYSIEEGVLIGVTGSFARAFRLEGRDLLLQSEGEILDFERKMRRFLNALPEGITLHFVVRSKSGNSAALQEYEDSIQVKNRLTQTFVEAKLNAYKRHPFLQREIFLFVVIHPAGKKPRSSFMPDLSIAFGKKAHRLSEREFGPAKEALLAVSNEVREGFLDLGFRIRPLEDTEQLRYLYELLNPAYADKVAPFQESSLKADSADHEEASLRSKLLLSSPLVDYRWFYLNDYFHRALNLLQLPESTNLKSMKNFEAALGKDYFLTMTLEVPDQEREKAGIRRQGHFAMARNFYSRSKDHEALAKADETDELLSEIAATSDKLLYLSLAVMVRHPDLEEARKLSREALRAFRRLGDAHGIEDHMNHDRLFMTFLPAQGDENPLAFLVRSEVAAHLLPLQASWKGTEKIGLLLKTYRDEPLRIDLFDPKLQAKHALVLGSTGSGKSFFTTHLLLSFLIESEDHEVIVIDLGGSYRKLAKILKGSYLEVECSEDYALNPFPAKRVLFPEGRDADATFLQFLKELLQRMISPKRVWSSSEKMILERAILEVYRNVSEEEAPLLGDVQKILRDFEAGDEEDRKKAYQFSKELTLFTEGEYGRLLNRPGTFDFDSRFSVFDLRKVSQYPELSEILLLIIPFALKRKFENLSKKKLLVMDECWYPLKETQGTDLIELFYRTLRKFNGAVFSITQNPEDYLASEIAGVMINNSPVKYVLRLKEGHEKLAQFGLNENEIEAARELEVRPGQYSEIFIKFDDQGVIAKLEPSPLEYWLATTDAVDLSEERRLRSEHPEDTDFQILESLATQFPGGVKKSKEVKLAA